MEIKDAISMFALPLKAIKRIRGIRAQKEWEITNLHEKVRDAHHAAVDAYDKAMESQKKVLEAYSDIQRIMHAANQHAVKKALEGLEPDRSRQPPSSEDSGIGQM